jgi:hypothetical protein
MRGGCWQSDGTGKDGVLDRGNKDYRTTPRALGFLPCGFVFYLEPLPALGTTETDHGRSPFASINNKEKHR